MLWQLNENSIEIYVWNMSAVEWLNSIVVQGIRNTKTTEMTWTAVNNTLQVKCKNALIHAYCIYIEIQGFKVLHSFAENLRILLFQRNVLQNSLCKPKYQTSVFSEVFNELILNFGCYFMLWHFCRILNIAEAYVNQCKLI